MPIQKRFKKPIAPVVAISGPRLLSVKDAATYLGAHMWAIRQMVRNRELPYVQIGRKHLIDKVDLDKFVEKNKIGLVA